VKSPIVSISLAALLIYGRESTRDFKFQGVYEASAGIRSVISVALRFFDRILNAGFARNPRMAKFL